MKCFAEFNARLGTRRMDVVHQIIATFTTFYTFTLQETTDRFEARISELERLLGNDSSTSPTANNYGEEASSSI